MRIPPVVMLAASAAASRRLAASDASARATPALRLAGLSLGAVGTAVALAGVAAFRQHRTTVDPRYPERASTLVDGGVYAWTRNPMYVGLVAVAAGWAVAHGSVRAAAGPAVLLAYLDRVQIAAEERALRDRFGPAYDVYARRVRRWLGRR
jgi:protein-S-isoprenylcysteine O-methyltransferase Ste14